MYGACQCLHIANRDHFTCLAVQQHATQGRNIRSNIRSTVKSSLQNGRRSTFTLRGQDMYVESPVKFFDGCEKPQKVDAFSNAKPIRQSLKRSPFSSIASNAKMHIWIWYLRYGLDQDV